MPKITPVAVVRHERAGSRRVLHHGVPQLPHPEGDPLPPRARPCPRARSWPSNSSSTAPCSQDSTAAPQFQFSEAVSFSIDCADQDEVDHYWNALTGGGGEESQCGWLKDRFGGVSWQVVPRRLDELMSDPDVGVVERVSEALMKMRKIKVPVLEEAARG